MFNCEICVDYNKMLHSRSKISELACRSMSEICRLSRKIGSNAYDPNVCRNPSTGERTKKLPTTMGGRPGDEEREENLVLSVETEVKGFLMRLWC